MTYAEIYRAINDQSSVDRIVHVAATGPLYYAPDSKLARLQMAAQRAHARARYRASLNGIACGATTVVPFTFALRKGEA